MNITGDNVKLVTIDNDDWTDSKFVVIDDKICIEQHGISDIIDYTTLANYIAIRKYYRDLADDDKTSLKSRFKRFIDNAIDPNTSKQKELFNDLNNWIFYWKNRQPSEQTLTKQQLQDIIDDLVKCFNTKKQLHDLSKQYGVGAVLAGSKNGTIRKHLELNDKSVRKQYGIPNEQSIVDKIVTVK